MHVTIFAATILAAAPLALAQADMTRAPSATPAASGTNVITMMWDNEPTSGAAAASGSTKAKGMSGMSASMTMSNGMPMSGMSGMSGMSMTTATGTAMAGMNMTGSAARMNLASGAMGMGWIVVSVGAGVGFLAGLVGA